MTPVCYFCGRKPLFGEMDNADDDNFIHLPISVPLPPSEVIWTPHFYDSPTHLVDHPVCPQCREKHLIEDTDGEMVSKVAAGWVSRHRLS